MNEQRTQAYLNFVNQLLSCNEVDEPQILQDNLELLDQKLLNFMNLKTQEYEKMGMEKEKILLIDRSQRYFLIIFDNTNPKLAISFLKQNLDKLDNNLIVIIKEVLSYQEDFDSEDIISRIDFINNFCSLIQELYVGNISINLEIVISLYEFTLENYNFENNTQKRASIINNLAIAYRKRIKGFKEHNLARAIELYNKVLKINTFELCPEEWAITQNNLGNIYLEKALYINNKLKQNITPNNLNENTMQLNENTMQSIHHYKNALKVWTFKDFPQEWIGVKNNLTSADSLRVDDKENNIKKAIVIYTQILENVDLLKTHSRDQDYLSYEWGGTQHNLGQAYYQIAQDGNIQYYESAITAYTEALKVRTFEKFPIEWAMTKNALALAYNKRVEGDKLDNLQKAVTYFYDALKIRTKEADPVKCLETARNLGNLYYDEQQWQLAAEAYLIAIEAVENARLEALNPQSRQQVLSDAIDVFHRIIQANLNLNQPEKALEYIERSKARNLVELMTQKNLKPQGVSQNIIEEYDRLRQQVVNEQIRLQNQSINQNLSRIDNLIPYVQDHNYLTEYQQQLDTFIEQKITPTDPTFKLTQKVEPITFKEIQSLIDPETCLIQWYITGEKVLTFIIHSNRKIDYFESVNLDFKELFNTINTYGSLYYSKDGKQEWLNKLPILLKSFSEVLHLNDIVNLISNTCKCLVIIPHWFLHILPIHAFPINQDKVLQDKYTVQYAPSCQILKQIQQPKQNELIHLLAIQNPTKDLTFTDLEVNIIANLFTQNQIIAKENATQNTVITQLKNSNYHCHHFSCHGSFNPNNPLESALILVDKEPLTLGEIFELNLKKSRLVVLSACETGMIDLKSISDEYIGLPSGFLFAGSQNVVSSLWTVSDLSTAFLMIKFYQILLDRNQQVSVAVALKTAQNWLQNLTVKEYLSQLNDCQQTIKPIQQKLTAKEFTRLMDMIEDEQIRIKGIESSYKLFENPFYWAAFTALGI
jgi:CHAT domain-containing protein/tetratricopeptide (TPR) repeat protein